MGTDRAQIIRTEAVVLRAMDYGESSRIVTLFTREQGRVGVMARGARATRSRFGSTLQPMTYVQVVYYNKPGRDLQSLTECSHLHLFPRLGSSLEHIEVGLRAVELASALTHSGESHPAILELLVDTLVRLDHAEKRCSNFWPYFALSLSRILGFNPAFSRADVQSLTDAGGWLDFETGAIGSGPRPGATASVQASKAALRAFAVFARADGDTIVRMNLDQRLRYEVESLVESYVRYHVDDAFPDRSARVFGQFHRS